MSIKKIPIDKIKPGMYLVGIDVSWMKSPFYNHRFMLNSQEDINELKKVGCRIIDIDIEKSSYDFNKPESQQPAQQPSAKPVKPNSYKKELELVINLERQAKQTIKKTYAVLDDPDAEIEQKELTRLVDESHQSFLRNGHALLSLLHGKRQGDVLIDYAFNNMTLALMLGERLDFTRKDLQNLTTAALLMDIGWSKIGPDLFQSKFSYTEDEFEIIKNHVDNSVEILESKGVDPEIVDLVVKHHEHIDGSGYYSQYTKNDIPLASQILSLVDHYNSQIMGVYDSGKIIPAAALKNIYRKAVHPQSHDMEMVELLIQLVGIFPLSSAVQLNTEEKAVVTKVNWRDALKPIVSIYYDKSGNPLMQPKVINLFDQGQYLEERTIKKVLNAENPQHDPAGMLNFNI